MARPIKNLAGKRFGRLLVVDFVGVKNKSAQWRCVCDCGNYTTVYATNLQKASKSTKSCGCISIEASAKRRTTAYDNSRLYQVWASMRQRCLNSRTINYKYYGARGIKVCDKWDKSFEAFQEWSLANGYLDSAKRGLCTIDRMDVNGDYDSDNCRWVDAKTQANNRRKRSA